MAVAYVDTRLRRRLKATAIERLQRRRLLDHPGLSRRLADGAEAGAPLQALLDRLPITDAATLRQDFQALNRLGISLAEARALAGSIAADRADGYSFGLSTGSEGEPGVFITSPSERARYIGTVLGKLLSPGELVGRRVALLFKHDDRLYRDAGRTPLIGMSYFDIGSPLDAWAVRLVAEQPDVVIGPPSVLLALSEHPSFEARPLRPRILLTGTEPTFPSDVRHLEAAYGIRPRPIYQACEGFVAIACRFGTLHVNEDVLIAEWRRFRCDATHAAPVITDVARRTQDTWRVLLSDIVRLGDGQCPCGSRFRALAGVEGRFADVLYAAGRRASEPRFLFPFVLDATLSETTPRDCDWRIEQDGLDRVSVATARDLTARERTRLGDALFAAGGWEQIRWDSLAPRPAASKRRRFLRAIDPRSSAILRALGPPSLCRDVVNA